MASSTFFIILFLFHLTLAQAAGTGGDLIFEDGYTVSTVLDGDKSNIKVNPHAIIHQSPPSDLFILLDSVASTFYTVSLLPTTSNETVIKRLAGNNEASYKDGELNSARFNKPRSFAVDFKGNVYVADQYNHAIRKITNSGVTTIAGGFSQKAGRTDGPAREASFSNNFELTFIPERCALMISDHGNRLVHQINLKSEDCKKHSPSVLGTTSAWLLGLGLSCILGLITGFMIRPYIIPYEGFKQLPATLTWIHCLTRLERQTVTFCSDIRSVIVKSNIYMLLRKIVILGLSHLSLMFRPIMVESRTTRVKSVSLLDLDDSSISSSSSSNLAISPTVDDQLRDLLTFDEGLLLPANVNKVIEQNSDGRKIDNMIVANLVNFEEEASRVCPQAPVDCSSGLVKRR